MKSKSKSSSATKTNINIDKLKNGPFEKLKGLIPFKAKKDDSETRVEFQKLEDDDTGKKKKSGLSPIKAIVIFGVVTLLLLDDDEEVKKPKKSIKVTKKEVLNKPAPKEIVKEKKPVDEPAEIKVAEIEAEIEPAEIKVTEIEAEIEPTIKTDSSIPESIDIAPLVEDEGEEDLDDLAIDDNTIAEDISSTEQVDLSKAISNLENKIGDNLDPTSELDTPVLEDDMSIEDDISNMVTEKVLKNLEKKLKEKKEKPTEMIIENSSEPVYELSGKALVYNCRGGHWACVTKSNYTQCQMNYAWNKSQDLGVACYPETILSSDDECGELQQYKIDSVASKSFCDI